MQRIKVAIADDHHIFRKGFMSLVEKKQLFEFVHDSENGQMLIDNLTKTLVDVVLVDLEMPVMNGNVAIDLIKLKFPHVKILAFRMHDDEAIIARIIEKGANGFLVKDDPLEVVVEAIITVYEKDFYFTPRVRKAMEKIANIKCFEDSDRS